MTETIPAMRARHRAEIAAAVVAQRKRNITQTQAAQNLGTSLSNLHNLICRYDIAWPLKRQGYRTDIHTRETAQ